MDNYKCVAPDFDRLLYSFDRGYMNSSVPSKALKEAMESVFAVLSDLAPLKKNKEAKAIWLMVPRGTIDDYDSYEDLLEWGEIENRDEYEERWKEDYPDPVSWYELVVAEGFRDENLFYRAISLGNKMIINADMSTGEADDSCSYREEAIITLCRLIVEAAKESMRKLKEGTYNEEVANSLPYSFRTGVIERSLLWERKPEWKESDMDGISAEIAEKFVGLVSKQDGKNELGRLDKMTANSFFRACAIGYDACGFQDPGLSLEERYFAHADGRDEGLSGRGHGINAGSGIDYDDPDSWDKWYFDRERYGGHPWEVVRGGNSTHLDLFVCHDRNHLDFLFRTGKINETEYKQKYEKAGYYFEVAGKYRMFEAINFFVSLTEAGLPVILNDAKEILNRIEGKDYVGIVPHDVVPRYCESMFPDRYGNIIDFIHVYEEELECFGDLIKWLPEEEAILLSD